MKKKAFFAILGLFLAGKVRILDEIRKNIKLLGVENDDFMKNGGKTNVLTNAFLRCFWHKRMEEEEPRTTRKTLN